MLGGVGSVLESKKMDKATKAKVKVSKPSAFDILRMVLMGLTFTIVCCTITILSFLKELTLPLYLMLGLHPRHSPLSWLAWLVSKAILASGGIFWRVTSDKSGGVPKAIYMYNHGSNLDPACVFGYLGFARQLYKKSLEGYPPLKWAMRSWDYVPVVRENREQAIAAINDKFAPLLRSGHSAALSPEGTRTLAGEVQPFKKGGFHLAVDTETPIVPVIINGNYELWPPSVPFAGVGNVTMRLLEPIYPKKGQTVDDLMEEVRAVFVRECQYQTKNGTPTAAAEAEEAVTHVLNYGAIAVFLALYCYLPLRLVMYFLF